MPSPPPPLLECLTWLVALGGQQKSQNHRSCSSVRMVRKRFTWKTRLCAEIQWNTVSERRTRLAVTNMWSGVLEKAWHLKTKFNDKNIDRMCQMWSTVVRTSYSYCDTEVNLYFLIVKGGLVRFWSANCGSSYVLQ